MQQLYYRDGMHVAMRGNALRQVFDYAFAAVEEFYNPRPSFPRNWYNSPGNVRFRSVQEATPSQWFVQYLPSA